MEYELVKEEPLTRLSNGTEVPLYQAMDWLNKLLADFYFPLHDGEKVLSDLMEASRGRSPPDHGKWYGERLAKYLNNGQLIPVVKELIESAVQLRDDHIELVSPFRDEKTRRLYSDNRRAWAEAVYIPEQALNSGVDRRVLGLDADIIAARDRDLISGNLTPLSTGEMVPVETAKYILWKLTLPDLDSDRLDEKGLVMLWRFCRGEAIQREMVECFIEEGFATPDGEADPAVKSVVLAATRWQNDPGGDRVVLVSPFSDPDIQQEYAHLCRNDGFEPVPPASEGAQLRETPRWIRRPPGLDTLPGSRS